MTNWRSCGRSTRIWWSEDTLIMNTNKRSSRLIARRPLICGIEFTIAAPKSVLNSGEGTAHRSMRAKYGPNSARNVGNSIWHNRMSGKGEMKGTHAEVQELLTTLFNRNGIYWICSLWVRYTV
jgi:hypothetical protein